MKIYLSGGIKNTSIEYQNWRKKCLSFKNNGLYENLEFINPISYFNYTDKLPKTNKQCLDYFMWQVRQCNILLINLDCSNSSCGSAMEVEHAFCHNIPIIGFGEKPDTWYNWIETRCTAIFDDVTEAVDCISYYYGG